MCLWHISSLYLERERLIKCFLRHNTVIWFWKSVFLANIVMCCNKIKMLFSSAGCNKFVVLNIVLISIIMHCYLNYLQNHHFFIQNFKVYYIAGLNLVIGTYWKNGQCCYPLKITKDSIKCIVITNVKKSAKS